MPLMQELGWPRRSNPPRKPPLLSSGGFGIWAAGFIFTLESYRFIMTEMPIKEWNGRTIRVREDHYICLTDIAQACGKRINDWNRLDRTRSYIETLAGIIGYDPTALVQIKRGGIPKNQGTWAHPKVAIRFAQWCSPDLCVQIDVWLDELLTQGTVSIVDKSPGEILLMYGKQLVEIEQKRLAAGQDSYHPFMF